MRGLARIGGPQAMAVIREAERGRDGAIAVQMHLLANALAGLTVPDDEHIGEPLDSVLHSRVTDPVGVRASELASRALELGREGRRKRPLDVVDIQPLEALAENQDTLVRYAAAYALAYAHTPAVGALAVAQILSTRLADTNADTRAVAVNGLDRQFGDANSFGADYSAAVASLLADRDWRVAVAAARALAGPHRDEAARGAVVAALPAWLAELGRSVDAGARIDAAAHVVIEALHAFIAHGAPVPAEWQNLDAGIPPLARGWIECLTAAVVRGDVEHCGHDQLPDHLRLPLLADLVKAGAADASWRRAAVRTMLVHKDARVRAAGLGALPATWKDGDADDHRATVGTVVSALASDDVIIASAAVDAAADLYAALGDDRELRVALDAALLARAGREHDPELSAALYDLVGKQALAAGVDVCRQGLTAQPVRAHAAAECLRALGQPPQETVQPAPAIVPPVDVALVINRSLRWHITTTRGEIVIALRPDIAPWNVATVVTLARRGFYDNTEFHRVVAGFVVQGGDPTASGAGGPGFTTPAEPSAGEHFARGAVGMADAGPDSGGSQFFIMHAPAPHLDGRYTYIGDVVAGQAAADALLVGDRIVKTTIE